MSDTKSCPRCKRRIAEIAMTCRCGWTGAAATEEREFRISTDPLPPSTSPLVAEIRTSYLASKAYRNRLPGHIANILPERQPGEDDE